MHKTSIMLLLALSLSFTSQAQTSGLNSNMELLDSIIAIMKVQSVYAEAVDWQEVEQKMKAQLPDDNNLESLIPPVEYLFEALGDFHGGLLLNGQRYNRFYKSEYHYPVSIDIVNEINQNDLQVDAQMLKGKIAYLKIPHLFLYGPEQISEATTKIREKICSLKAKKPKGWIIDLRTNTGGNMYPMFAGLGEILPNISLSGDSRDGASFASNWHNAAGHFFMWGQPMTSTPLSCTEPTALNINESQKIAVLTSRYTASAGEAVASSLKSQKNIRLFGEITSGYSSTTGWFPLRENLILLPTVAYYISLDGTWHRNGVYPDQEIIEEIKLDSLTSGKMIETAIKWLKD